MTSIAKVQKSNGAAGEVVIGLRGISPEEISLDKPVFIDFDGIPVPFYFESFTPRGTSKAVVRLTGIRSLKDAEELVGREIVSDEYDSEDEEDLTGWTILDAKGRMVGVISGAEPIPGNPCVYVTTPDKKEVLVPLSEDLILALDEENEIIRMDIPEGLI